MINRKCSLGRERAEELGAFRLSPTTLCTFLRVPSAVPLYS